MQTKDITPKQYAKWKGCTIQNITKHIRAGNDLPHVITVKNFSRFYLLEVPQELTAESFKVGKIVV
jgi:hypothetical protein